MMTHQDVVDNPILPETFFFMGLQQVNSRNIPLYRNRIWFVLTVRTCCLLNAISAMMNTPQSFIDHPGFETATLVMDVIALIGLSIECGIKMYYKGVWKRKKQSGSKNTYFANSGRIFEFTLLVCLFISLSLQILEMKEVLDPAKIVGSEDNYEWYILVSVWRVPRPLSLLRVMKTVFNISIPAIPRQSLKQVKGATIFLLYFICTFAIIGVQSFGQLNYYCTRNNKTADNVTLQDLTIPEKHCHPSNSDACPTDFKCVDLKDKQNKYYFTTIFEGLLNVYEAASMEGWSTLMFLSIDSMPNHIGKVLAAVYYIAIILMIAMIARNVFVAIVTEVFANLRLQISKKGGQAEKKQLQTAGRNVLRRDNDSIKLVSQKENLKKGRVNTFHFSILS